MVGDAILVYERYFFVYGVVAFAVAQVRIFFFFFNVYLLGVQKKKKTPPPSQASYVAALGFSPLRPGLFVTLAAPSVLYLLLVLSSVDLVLWVALALYAVLLVSMCWRAMAFAASEKADHWYTAADMEDA